MSKHKLLQKRSGKKYPDYIPYLLDVEYSKNPSIDIEELSVLDKPMLIAHLQKLHDETIWNLLQTEKEEGKASSDIDKYYFDSYLQELNEDRFLWKLVVSTQENVSKDLPNIEFAISYNPDTISSKETKYRWYGVIAQYILNKMSKTASLLDKFIKLAVPRSENRIKGIHRIDDNTWEIKGKRYSIEQLEEAARTKKWDAFDKILKIDKDLLGRASRHTSPYTFPEWLIEHQTPKEEEYEVLFQTRMPKPLTLKDLMRKHYEKAIDDLHLVDSPHWAPNYNEKKVGTSILTLPLPKGGSYHELWEIEIVVIRTNENAGVENITVSLFDRGEEVYKDGIGHMVISRVKRLSSDFWAGWIEDIENDYPNFKNRHFK